MLLQYASSGRPPVVVNFVDSITLKDMIMAVIHSEGYVETEKSIEQGAVIVVSPEDLPISVKVVSISGSVETLSPFSDKLVILKKDGCFTISQTSFSDESTYSIFVEELNIR